MFKDAEKGDKEINIERTEQALDTNTEIIAAGCPFVTPCFMMELRTKEKSQRLRY